MTKVNITAHTYVCELPETIQNQIFQECKETFKSLAFPVDIEAELDNVKGCKRTRSTSRNITQNEIHVLRR